MSQVPNVVSLEARNRQNATFVHNLNQFRDQHSRSDVRFLHYKEQMQRGVQGMRGNNFVSRKPLLYRALFPFALLCLVQQSCRPAVIETRGESMDASPALDGSIADATSDIARDTSGADTSFDIGPAPRPGECSEEGGVVVDGRAELMAALASASAGDVLVLRPGAYGALDLNRDFGTRALTLRSACPFEARFERVEQNHQDPTGGYRFIGVEIGTVELLRPTQRIAFIRSKIRFATLRNIQNIVFSECILDARGDLHVMRVQDVASLTIERSILTNAQEDLLAIAGASRDIQILYNVFWDTMPRNIPVPEDRCRYNHSDAIQTYGLRGVTPTQLVIRGNLILDDPANNDVRPADCTGQRLSMQGIFISDPQRDGYRDVLIEENLIHVGTPNAIYVWGSQRDVTIRNNTLKLWPGSDGGGIRVVERGGVQTHGIEVINNVCSDLRDDTVSRSTTRRFESNFDYEHRNEESEDYFANFFESAERTERWEDFLPKDSAPIRLGSRFGAQDLLRRLNTGEFTYLRAED